MTSLGSNCNVSPQIGFDRYRQNIVFAFKLQTQAGKNQILVCSPVFQFQPVRCGYAKPADKTHVKPFTGIISISQITICSSVGPEERSKLQFLQKACSI